MITWSLTIHSPAGPTTIVGQALDEPAALPFLLAAVRKAVHSAEDRALPQYQLHLDSRLIALISTGRDDDGRPNRTEVLELIDRLEVDVASAHRRAPSCSA
jgi:hypothetical protein